MIAGGAGGSFILGESVDEVLKMDGSRVSKRIDPIFGQNPGTISILPNGFAAFHETESEVRPAFVRVQAGFDPQFAADGSVDRAKLAIQSKIEIVLRPFA